jgi:hypothetical protein
MFVQKKRPRCDRWILIVEFGNTFFVDMGGQRKQTGSHAPSALRPAVEETQLKRPKSDPPLIFIIAPVRVVVIYLIWRAPQRFTVGSPN